MIRQVANFGLAICLCVLLACNVPKPIDTSHDMARPAEDAPLITIIEYSEWTYVPPKWLREPHPFAATPPSSPDVSAAKVEIAAAAGKYPPTVISRNLDRIYLCGRMYFGEFRVAGTNSKDALYLVTEVGDRDPTVRWTEEAFHHELASILLRNYSQLMPEHRWMLCNVPEFQYGKGGIDAMVRGGASLELDQALADKGFVSSYALSSFDNDVRETARWVFGGDANFRRLVKQSDRLRCKVDLLKEFYLKIDPGFVFPD